MKVLLVNAPMLYVGHLARANASAHLQLIYSYLRERGVEVHAYDPAVEHGIAGDQRAEYLDHIREDLSRERYELVGISCWTSHQYLGSLEVARILRQLDPEVPLAVGGYHPTLVPDDFLGEQSLFDWVVQGPGELFLLELCRRRPHRPSRAELVQGEAAPFDHIHYDWSYPYHLCAFFLSRGCPFSCLYCSEPTTSYTHYSVERAAEEYQRACQHSRDGVVHLCDALFGGRKQWRRDFLRAVAPTRSLARLEAEVRVDQLEEEDIRLLGDLRAQLYVGVETGSARMLSIMRKTTDPAGYLKRCIELLERCDRHGVGYHLGMLYNHPGETATTLRESIDFFWKLLWEGPSAGLLDFVTHAYMHLPGSPVAEVLGQLAVEHGTVVHHPGWWREPGLDHWDKCEKVTPSRALSQETAVAMARKMDVANWTNSIRRQARDGSTMSSSYFTGIAAKPD